MLNKKIRCPENKPSPGNFIHVYVLESLDQIPQTFEFFQTYYNNQAIHVCVDVVINEFLFNFVKLQIKVWKTFCKIDFDISDFYLFLFSFH